MPRVEKGFPAPPMKAGRKLAYPWPDMEPGDSLYFEKQERQSAILKLATLWARRNRPEATFRTQRENGGFRIWRVT